MNLIHVVSLIFLQSPGESAESGDSEESTPLIKHEHDIIQDLGLENWTSCEEFLTNTTFDVDSVTDVDWRVFYFWKPDLDYQSYNIKFSKPTSTLVDRFKVELTEHNSSVEWDKAVLFMETSIDFSALYISTEVPGKFRFIPSFAFHMDRIPLLIFGLKVVQPSYLGIMNCQYRFCYALAPADKMPHVQDIKLAAEKIGFRGDQNRSYLFRPDPAPVVPRGIEDDADEDEPIEIDNDLDFDD